MRFRQTDPGGGRTIGEAEVRSQAILSPVEAGDIWAAGAENALTTRPGPGLGGSCLGWAWWDARYRRAGFQAKEAGVVRSSLVSQAATPRSPAEKLGCDHPKAVCIELWLGSAE